MGGQGTGFLFSYEIEPDKMIQFFVTNKHVIENAEKGAILFHEKKEGEDVVLLGKSVTFGMDEFEKGWIQHPDDDIDIVVMPITLNMIEKAKQQGKEVYFKTIPNKFVPTEEHISTNIDAIEEVIFIGYPKGIYDRKNLMPIVRKGITATPIPIDFEGKPQFLIDASVFPGSSGSPVFICNIGSYPMKGGRGMTFGNRLFFLGILSAMKVSQENIDVDLPSIKVPWMKYNQLLNLGIVYKSNLILELIEKIIKDNTFKIPQNE
ncbi:MAG: S1 family peptidase [Promethearchaeota archaeon]